MRFLTRGKNSTTCSPRLCKISTSTDTWSRYSGGLKLHRHRRSLQFRQRRCPGIGTGWWKKILSPSLSLPFSLSSFFYTHRSRENVLYSTEVDLRGCRSWKLVKPNEIHALIRQMIKPWFIAALALRCCERGTIGISRRACSSISRVTSDSSYAPSIALCAREIRHVSTGWPIVVNCGRWRCRNPKRPEMPFLTTI